jgi:two-component system, LytTR family, sensor kinase
MPRHATLTRMIGLDYLRANRNALFWSLHSAGWLAYGVLQSAGALLWPRQEGYPYVFAVALASGFLLSAPLRLLYRRLWTQPPWMIVAGALLACFGVALLWRLLINAAQAAFMPPLDEAGTLLGLLLRAANSSFILLSWTGLYFGIRYYESLQLERERGLRAAALAQEAQLKMLRYQLNPHFLFNTLNTISTLILDRQNDLANQAVTRLSEFLRYTLDQDPMKRVTLREEIDAINLYMSTERLRFGERLRLEFDIEDRALDALMPSLLLQPLLENAVKYAVAPREQGGAIRIEGRVRTRKLEVAVVDDGPGLAADAEQANGRGVGLRNTRDRLRVLYGGAHRFVTLDAAPGLRVEVEIPLERPPA